jgi:hypothetical protein
LSQGKVGQTSTLALASCGRMLMELQKSVRAPRRHAVATAAEG